MATTTTAPPKLATVRLERPRNDDGSALYPDYLPFYDPLEKVDDIGEFDHYDPGTLPHASTHTPIHTSTQQLTAPQATVQTPSSTTSWEPRPR